MVRVDERALCVGITHKKWQIIFGRLFAVSKVQRNLPCSVLLPYYCHLVCLAEILHRSSSSVIVALRNASWVYLFRVQTSISSDVFTILSSRRWNGNGITQKWPLMLAISSLTRIMNIKVRVIFYNFDHKTCGLCSLPFFFKSLWSHTTSLQGIQLQEFLQCAASSNVRNCIPGRRTRGRQNLWLRTNLLRYVWYSPISFEFLMQLYTHTYYSYLAFILENSCDMIIKHRTQTSELY